MDLMMRRAHKQAAQYPTERDPQMRVLQMNIGVDEEHKDDVVVGQGILIRGFAEEVTSNAIGDRRGDCQDIGKYQHVDRMNPKIGQRRQHACRMVHLVEFPQEGHAMTEIMVDPVT